MLYYTRCQNEIVSFKTSIKLYENNIRRFGTYTLFPNSREIRTTIIKEFETLFADPHVNG